MILLYVPDWLYLGWASHSCWYVGVTSCDISIHAGRLDLELAWSRKRSHGSTEATVDRPITQGAGRGR